MLKSMKVPQLCPIFATLGILQARILEWVAFPSPGDLPNPGIKPRFPALQAILYQLSNKGSPRIVGSLSLLEQIFPTQESNWSLLHCRQTVRFLYQLSCQGSPVKIVFVTLLFTGHLYFL